jgi:hypothetical protein
MDAAVKTVTSMKLPVGGFWIDAAQSQRIVHHVVVIDSDVVVVARKATKEVYNSVEEEGGRRAAQSSVRHFDFLSRLAAQQLS